MQNKVIIVLYLIGSILFSCSQINLLEPEKKTLKIVISGQGTVFPDQELTTSLDLDIPINATPATGSQFVNWTILEGTGVLIADNTKQQTTVKLTASSAKLQANFSYIPYKLVVNNTDGRGLPKPEGEITANYQVPIELQATPYQGYCFMEWRQMAGKVRFLNSYLPDTSVFLDEPADAVIEAAFMKSIQVISDMGTTEAGGALSIAGTKDEIHMCAHNCAPTIEDFRFTRSLDRGKTWSNVVITDGLMDTSYAQMAITENGAIGVCFNQNRAPSVSNYDIKFKVSYDHGTTWQPVQTILQDMSNAYLSMQAIGNTLYCCYYSSAEKALKFIKSSEIRAGSPITWSTPSVIDALKDGDVGIQNAMAVSGNRIYISYKDVTNTNIKCAWSADFGASWMCKTIDNSVYDVGNANYIAADGLSVVVVYEDTTNKCLKFSSSDDGGNTWPISSIKTIDNTTTPIHDTAIKYSKGTVYLSYIAGSVGSTIQLLFNKFPANDPNSKNILKIDPLTEPSISSAMEKTGNDLYVVYRDKNNVLKFAKSSTDGDNW